MAARVIVPVAALPLWVMAVAALMVAVIGLAYWRSERSAMGAAFGRAALSGALYWTTEALAIGSRTPFVASSWYRLAVPAAFLACLGLVDAAVAMSGMRRPRVLDLLWVALAAVFVASLADPGSAALLPVHRGPDGFYLVRLAGQGWFEGLRLLVLFGFFVALAALFVRGFVVRHKRHWLYYAGAAALGLPIAFNDSVWAQTHRTPFPTAWILGVVAVIAFWREIRDDLAAKEVALHFDRTTGARSRAFGEVFGARALKAGSVGVVYIDLDGFKAVNDRFGHAAGDAFLHEVVRRTRAAVEPRGVVVRMGGDEIVALVPGAGAEDGSRLTESVRRAITGTPILIDAGPGTGPGTAVAATVSLGFASSGRNGELAELLSRADEAMYREKREHRLRGGVAMPLASPELSG
jgi:diguanylate cyclase (GGDEF)-like protein